jgi:hypothetical protein
MSTKDRFRALEERKPINAIVKSVEEKMDASSIEKKKRTLVTFALDSDDVEKFNSLQVKLSMRDGVMYKKQDLQIACVRQFIEIAEKNIEKIKIEKF